MSKIKALLQSEKFKGSAFPFLFKLLGLGFGFIMAFIVSKDLGAEGWGLFSLITTAAMFCIHFAKLGFDTAFLKFTAEFNASHQKEKINLLYKRILLIILPIGLLITLSVYFHAAYLAETIFHKAYLTPYIQWGSFLILPSILTLINSEGIRGFNRISEYSFLQNAGVYLIFLLIYLAVKIFVSPDNLLPLKIFLASTIIVYFISLYHWLRTSAYGTPENQQSLSFSPFLKVAMPMFWSNALIIVIGWTDTILLGIFDQDADVGIYNVALKISNLVIMPLLIANSILAPKYASASILGDSKGLTTLILNASKYISLLSLPIFVFLLIFSEFILGFFGEQYVKGKYILMILAAGQYFNTLCGTTDALLQMTGNEKAFSTIIGVGAVLNVLLNLMLIPPLGITGAAISSCASLILWNVIGLFYIKKKFGIYPIYNPFVNQ